MAASERKVETSDVEINANTNEWEGGVVAGGSVQPLFGGRWTDGWSHPKDCQAQQCPKGSDCFILHARFCLSRTPDHPPSVIIKNQVSTSRSRISQVNYTPLLDIAPEDSDNDDRSHSGAKLVSAGGRIATDVFAPWASTKADEVASGSPLHLSTIQLRRQGGIVSPSKHRHRPA